MRRFRTTIALAIVAAMIFSLAGLAAAATVKTTAFSDVASDSTAAGAFNVLAGLGVYQGDSGVGGPARPNDPITRLEAAAVVVRLIGKESVARSLSSYAPSFTDANQIPDWGWGYVNVATTLGILKGYPDGSFQPNNNVTHAEMIAMLVRAAELDGAVTGTWPTNYVVYGGTWGITDDVNVFANLPATRAEVAIMAANTLAVDKKLNKDGELDDVDSLRVRLELAVEGTVNNITTTKIRIDNVDHDLADEVFLSGADNLNAFLNQEVVAYKVDKKVVAIAFLEEDEASTTVTGKLKNVEATRIRVDSRNYPLADNVSVTVNETVDNDLDLDVLKDSLGENNFPDEPTVTITLNKDGEVTAVRVDHFNIEGFADDFEEAEDATEDNKITIDGIDLIVDSDTRLTLNGKAATFREITEAIDDFNDKWGKYPYARAQTGVELNADDEIVFIEVDDTTAIAIEVSTDTVDGRVVGLSQEGSKYYVTLRKGSSDNKVEVTKNLYQNELEFDTDVTLALDPTGKGVAIVDEAGVADAFVAKLASIRQVGSEKWQATYEFGDGSTLTRELQKKIADYNTSLVGKAVVSDDRGRNFFKSLADAADAGIVQELENQKVVEKKSTYLRFDDAGVKIVPDTSVLVRDNDDWKSLSNVREGSEGWTIYVIGDFVWYMER